MGLKTVPVANANGDAGKQIADIHNLIAEGATGFILVATDSDAIVPALNYAERKHVPIVSTDIGPSGGHTAMIVRADNLRMGVDAVQLDRQETRRQGHRAFDDGRSGDDQRPRPHHRLQRVHEGELPRHQGDPAADLLEERQGNGGGADGGDLDAGSSAIYMQSDSVMLAGVINVLKSAGKLTKVGDASHIMLVSIDGTPYALRANPGRLARRIDLAAAGPLREIWLELSAGGGGRKDFSAGADRP